LRVELVSLSKIHDSQNAYMKVVVGRAMDKCPEILSKPM